MILIYEEKVSRKCELTVPIGTVVIYVRRARCLLRTIQAIINALFAPVEQTDVLKTKLATLARKGWKHSLFSEAGAEINLKIAFN